MPMTVAVTRNVPDRVRGFLASCMCEIAPGVYTAPRMTAAVRDRVQAALQELCPLGPDVAVIMTWPDTHAPGGQAVWNFGSPRVELFDHDGVYLVRRAVREEDMVRLITERNWTGRPHTSVGRNPTEVPPRTRG